MLQGADMEEANPGGWALQCGQNFSVNHAPSHIDFAAIHVWPDNWERCGHPKKLSKESGRATTIMRATTTDLATAKPL
jgi:hypothetical protein